MPVLIERIKQRRAVVSVIGLGYVGLPLAIAFAEAGFRVLGLDVDGVRVADINAGSSYINDIPCERLARLISNDIEFAGNGSTVSFKNQIGRMSATSDFSVLKDTDVVIVCVPTPLTRTREPDLSYVGAAINQISRYLHPGMLIVIESTNYPGATEELILPQLQQSHEASLSVGSDFFLCFSPERTDPGRKNWTLHNTPKVIGGITLQCSEVTRLLYETVVQEVIPVSSTKVAEMTKLLENTFRATNIALINEFAMMCDRLGIDVWEVIEAAKTKPFGFMSFYPGPGVGGHCIPIDPQYLAWKLKALDYNPRFIQLASEINLDMPAYVLGKIADALNEQCKPLKGSRLLILGVAYKAGVSDPRESPALDLIHLLSAKRAKVSYHDPYLPELNVEGTSLASVELDLNTLQEADCVVITTPHQGYDWQWIVDNSKLVVDTRNALSQVLEHREKIVKL